MRDGYLTATDEELVKLLLQVKSRPREAPIPL